jgi:hypothetical protein
MDNDYWDGALANVSKSLDHLNILSAWRRSVRHPKKESVRLNASLITGLRAKKGPFR